MQTAVEPVPADVSPSQRSDAELLFLFTNRSDPDAFTQIVQRHGPMVLGVCRRIVANAHDAEDAFQATFLVLVRKAGVVRATELGQWLYGVAYRTAHKARVIAARRENHERRAGFMKSQTVHNDRQWSEVRAVLDDEISRLPARYRGPVIACDLQSKSRQQAALDLGVNENTLSSRLARGREMLARRLSRRGVSLTAAALASLLGAHAASAAPSVGLVATTVSAAGALSAGASLAGAGVLSAKAAILSDGVIKAMFIAKAKIAAAIILGAAVVGTGAGVATKMAFAQKAPKVAKEEAPKAKPDKANWIAPDVSGRVVAVSADGSEIKIEVNKGQKIAKGEGGKGEGGKGEGGKGEGNGKPDAPKGQGIKGEGGKGEGLKGDKGDAGKGEVVKGEVLKGEVVKGEGGKGDVAKGGGGKGDFAKGDGGKGDGGKGDFIKVPPVVTTIKVPAAAKVTYSAIGPDGDKPTVGYNASVWLVTGSADTAASVQYMGLENFKGGGKQASVGGKVTAISVDGKRLTVETGPVKGGGKEKGVPAPAASTSEFDLTDKTVYTFSGVTEGGAHPVEGMDVQIVPNEKDPKVAASARFFGKEAGVKGNPDDRQADLTGQVSEVDNGGKRLWIAGKAQVKNEAAPKTEVQLTDATKTVYINVPLDGAKPMEGYMAQVWLDGNSATRVRFDVFKPEKGADIQSRVVAVSPDGKTMTVEVPGATKQDGPQRKEISIADAKLIFNGVEAGQAKVTEGYEARVWLDPDAPNAAARVMMSNPANQSGPVKGL